MSMPIHIAERFQAELAEIQGIMRGTPANAKQNAAHWEIWKKYCSKHKLDPFLIGIKDPIPFLQVFGAMYRDGRIAPGGKPVKATTVSHALTSIGEEFKLSGKKDPRTYKSGNIDIRISLLIRSYTIADVGQG